MNSVDLSFIHEPKQFKMANQNYTCPVCQEPLTWECTSVMEVGSNEYTVYHNECVPEEWKKEMTVVRMYAPREVLYGKENSKD